MKFIVLCSQERSLNLMLILRWYGTLHMDQNVRLNLMKKDQLCAITLMKTK